ncbi:FecCD family ABC transporter permease [Veillonella agrestimuris]|uniref:FecCD family ABC transporter permease n=1 Tax=Veillonella agrestimuris TaxID=2941340 RepID=UPI00203CF9E0|nr:iron ABC transporter permease [Veillonella agrestimuris]
MNTIIFLIILYIVSIALSLVVGAVSIPIEKVSEFIAHVLTGQWQFTGSEQILWSIRLPRSIGVAFVGSALAMVGVYMQTLTRNALAEPYILGVSSGAGVGAAAAIVWGLLGVFGSANVIVSAFIGSMVAMFLVLWLVGWNPHPVRLVLIGMGVSAFFSALTLAIIYSATNEAQVRSAMFWLVGTFSGIQWVSVPYIMIVSLLALVVGLWNSPHLDIMLLGRRSATQLGLSIERFQFALVFIASLVMGVVVSYVGVIGFVGLIIPHICRILVGPLHKKLLTYSFLLGGIGLQLADMVSRVVIRPEEMPIGVITSLVGAPIFIYLIRKAFTEGTS